MVFVGKRCFNLHRFMFIFMGLWPYQKPCIWHLQAIFMFGAYSSFLFFQLTTLLTSVCNMDCILKKFSYISITVVYILNYYAFYFNSESIKQSLEHMKLDWKTFENSGAIRVLGEYLSEAYIFVLIVWAFLTVSGLLFLTLEIKSIILDAIIPINESRTRKVEIDFEFFIFDEEHYFFLHLMQEIIGTLIGVGSVVSTATFLITIGKHSCAIYKIASCLIQNTVTDYTLQLPAAQRMQFMHRSICFSVHMHRRTMQFIESLLVSFNLWYFPLLLIAVLSLSCILFRLYNAIVQFNDYYDILLSFVLLYCYLTYLFVGNFMAHSYSEHSEKILEATYDTLWYMAPFPIQKLFLIMLKSIKIHKIVIGGLFVPSIEGFSTLITSAVSYFTVIHTIRS